MARPATFERQEVLEKAMQAFWDKGYCATSMAELVSATGLKPGSLYGAFQSKEQLFCEAIDFYAERGEARLAAALHDAPSPLAGIRGFFQHLAIEATDPEAQHSCFLVNSVLELARHDPPLQARLSNHLARMEAVFRDALAKAREHGELPAHKDPAGIAAFLMSNIWGLRVLSNTAPEPARVQAVVDQILTILD